MNKDTSLSLVINGLGKFAKHKLYIFSYFPTSMEVVNVGEKGQIVIPKKFRDDLKLSKGSKLIIEEKGNKLTMKKIQLDDDTAWMLLGEETLKKTWDNKYDARWDDVL